MPSLKSLLIFIYLGLVYATDLNNFVLHENVKDAPNGFISLGSAQPQDTVKLRIALAQPNDNAIVDAVYNVSDPNNSLYGQHLSKTEVCSSSHTPIHAHLILTYLKGRGTRRAEPRHQGRGQLMAARERAERDHDLPCRRLDQHQRYRSPSK